MQSEVLILDLLDALTDLERNFEVGTSFNIFKAVNIAKREIHHSRFLAFLLDPCESHGLGDRFLREMLVATATVATAPPVSRLTLTITDLSGATVFCEREFIDITVQIPALNLIFVIENKIDASERQNQLSDYRALIGRSYPSCRFFGCFLSPDGYEGADEQWTPISYSVVANGLKRIMARSDVGPDVTSILRQYISLIEKDIMVSDELISACKKIYAQHREAFELILKHGRIPVLPEAFQVFQDEHSGLQSLALREGAVVFISAAWQEIPGFQIVPSKTKWEPTCPIKYWFELKDKTLKLVFEAGPVPPESAFSRDQFVQGLGGKVAKKEDALFTRIRTKTLKLPDFPTVENLKAAMDELWKMIEGPSLNERVCEVAAACLRR